jgi:hypothetical protein
MVASSRGTFLCLRFFVRRSVVLDTPIPNFRNRGKNIPRGRLSYRNVCFPFSYVSFLQQPCP